VMEKTIPKTRALFYITARHSRNQTVKAFRLSV